MRQSADWLRETCHDGAARWPCNLMSMVGFGYGDRASDKHTSLCSDSLQTSCKTKTVAVLPIPILWQKVLPIPIPIPILVLKSKCQYRYQYFFGNTFFCTTPQTPSITPTVTLILILPIALTLTVPMDMAFRIYILHSANPRSEVWCKNRGEPHGCMVSITNRVMAWTVRTVLLHVRSKYVSSLSLCLEILSPCVMI